MSKKAASVSLEDRVSALKADRGDAIRLDEIGSVVGSLVEGTAQDDGVDTIAAELREMLAFVKSARAELTDMQPKSLSKRDIPDAAQELDAVVAATDSAASEIMNAADELGEMAGDVDADLSMTLTDISTRLFEASSFQDLTGQRITKVARTLTHLEERLGKLADAIGDDYVRPADEDELERDDEGVVKNAEDLLHGPQMEGEGNSQDEIDAILASFD